MFLPKTCKVNVVTRFKSLMFKKFVTKCCNNMIRMVAQNSGKLWVVNQPKLRLPKYVFEFICNTIKQEGGDDSQSAKPVSKKLFQLSDASGKLVFKQVAEGTLHKGLLNSNDVFILDAGSVVYTWIGGKTSANERKSAMFYALDYLKEHGRDASKTTISRVSEGGEPAEFLQQLK